MLQPICHWIVSVNRSCRGWHSRAMGSTVTEKSFPLGVSECVCLAWYELVFRVFLCLSHYDCWDRIQHLATLAKDKQFNNECMDGLYISKLILIQTNWKGFTSSFCLYIAVWDILGCLTEEQCHEQHRKTIITGPKLYSYIANISIYEGCSLNESATAGILCFSS